MCSYRIDVSTKIAFNSISVVLFPASCISHFFVSGGKKGTLLEREGTRVSGTNLLVLRYGISVVRVQAVALFGHASLLVVAGRRITDLINSIGAHGVRGWLVLGFGCPWHSFLRYRAPRLIGQFVNGLAFDFLGQSLVYSERFEALHPFDGTWFRVGESRGGPVVDRRVGATKIVARNDQVRPHSHFLHELATAGGLRLHRAVPDHASASR